MAAATGGPGAVVVVAGGVAGALVAVLIVGLLAVVLLRLRRQRARLDLPSMWGQILALGKAKLTNLRPKSSVIHSG